jgi:hypothetical protein
MTSAFSEDEFLSHVAPIVHRTAGELHIPKHNDLSTKELLDRIDQTDTKARALVGMYMSTYRHWYSFEREIQNAGKQQFLIPEAGARLAQLAGAKELAQRELSTYLNSLIQP